MKKEEIQQLLTGVKAAGLQVLDIYQRDFSVETKADNSPLTEADMTANKSLMKLVREVTPELPVLTEECSEVPFTERCVWERYWLIDPLDGTKEFINRNGEFTLNLALIENGVPVFGIVHAPVLDTSWWGSREGAWKQIGDAEPEPIRVRALPDPESQAWQIVGSRLHGSKTFEAFCKRLPPNERVSMGSSLKLCLVAEGKADLYPRLAPTCEWDTAAAQAVVTAAGGEVLDARTLQPLRCNQQESVLNPFFIVCGGRDPRWETALAQTLSEEAQSPYEQRANDSKAEVIWNRATVTPELRSAIKGHKGRCIWFTGLSGSGKSTLANALEVELNQLGYHTMLLDGDNIRHGLCKDLGMSEADRNENIRRIGELARLFTDAGLIVITAFISPYRADRDTARALFAQGDFVEVFVDTPLEVCEQRDPKGLYEKARAGKIRDFTGIDSPYEKPLKPEVAVSTSSEDILNVIQLIKKYCL